MISKIPIISGLFAGYSLGKILGGVTARRFGEWDEPNLLKNISPSRPDSSGKGRGRGMGTLSGEPPLAGVIRAQNDNFGIKVK
jgi:hypothetical protein